MLAKVRSFQGQPMPGLLGANGLQAALLRWECENTCVMVGWTDRQKEARVGMEGS